MTVPIPRAVKSLFTNEQWKRFRSIDGSELERLKRILDSGRLSPEQDRVLRRMYEYRWSIWTTEQSITKIVVNGFTIMENKQAHGIFVSVENSSGKTIFHTCYHDRTGEKLHYMW